MKKYNYFVDEDFELYKLEDGISNILDNRGLSYTKSYNDSITTFNIALKKRRFSIANYHLRISLRLNINELEVIYYEEFIQNKIEKIHVLLFGQNEYTGIYDEINDYVNKVLEKEVYINMNYRRRIIAATPIISLIIFLCMGYIFNMWAYGCLAFLLIPLMPIMLGEVSLDILYPIIVLVVYISLGFAFGIWHPAWIMFLTIPVYYILFPAKYRRLFKTRYNYEN